MESLIIEATGITPKITFDPVNRIFEISGESRPENVREFFEPIIKWLEDYCLELTSMGNIDPLIFRIFMEYFNSSSAKYFLYITKKLQNFVASGIPVTVEWCYISEDEDMKETGEEMQNMSKIPFTFVEIP